MTTVYYAMVFPAFQAHMAISRSCRHTVAIVPALANWLDHVPGLCPARRGSSILVEQFFTSLPAAASMTCNYALNSPSVLCLTLLPLFHMPCSPGMVWLGVVKTGATGVDVMGGGA